MNILGLMPIMLAEGTGADVAKRIATPMQGGLVSLTILTLFVIPALYVVWRRWEGHRQWRMPADPA
jgi:Cu(I)/Ag(I) efflux system membrane protein CusA/SilA